MKLRIFAAVLAALTLTACGQAAPSTTTAQSSSAAPSHNQADVDFAAAMVPHHRQAVEMADLIPDRTDNPKLRSLGERVRKAQQPEIDMMTGWLKRWGAAESTDHHSGHGGHSGHGMAGMMTPEQMARLREARGVAFDHMWLRMMIEHHKGALEMARAELAAGSDAEARKLAQAVIDSQQKEIDEMTELLAQR